MARPCRRWRCAPGNRQRAPALEARQQPRAGRRTTKRAPRPSSGSSRRHVPPWESRDRADDREAEAARAAAVAGAAEEALEDLVAQLGRDARARRPRRTRTTSPLRRSTVASTAVPGSVWRSAFSSRLSVSRCSSSRAPSTSAPGARRDADQVVAGDGLELAGRLGDDLGEVDGRVRGGAAGVGAGEQQQVGDQPAHAAAGAQRGGGGLARLALQLHLEQLEVGQHGGERRAQLVRARRRRTGAGARASPRSRRAPRRARGACPRACARARTPRRSASGWGMVSDGSRVRSISRAASVSRGIGAIARRGGGEAGEQRERGAAEHAEAEEDADAVRRRLRRRRACARTARTRRRRARPAMRARLDPVAVVVLRRRAAAAAGTARRGRLAITRAVLDTRRGRRRSGSRA